MTGSLSDSADATFWKVLILTDSPCELNHYSVKYRFYPILRISHAPIIMQDFSQAPPIDPTASATSATLTQEETEEIKSRSFRAGLSAAAPSLTGIAAWGLVTGIAMIKSHLSIAQALGMTLIVFGGSAQLAALPLIAAAAPIWVIFLTGLMINLRFVIFSVIIAPHFSDLKLHQKAFWGYMTGDISMIFFMRRFPTEKPELGKFEYTKGLFVSNWVAWQAGSIAGIFLGQTIPESWGVGFAGTLAILCILLPMVLKRATLIGVLAAGAVALAGYHWPYKLGVLLAVVVGMLCAMSWEEWRARREKAILKIPKGTI